MQFITKILKGTKKRPAAKRNVYVKNPSEKHLSFNIAGLSYHVNALEMVAKVKKNYDSDEALIASGQKLIYKYSFKGELRLLEEPTNKHDKNAVKILYNDAFIGYVPAEYAPIVKKLIQGNKIIDIQYTIGGGDYKKVKDGVVHQYESDYTSNVIITYR